MSGGRGRRRRARLVIQRTQPIRRRRNPRPGNGRNAGRNTGSSTTVRRTGVGSAIASGVRTVLGVLPGSAITTKLADVVFKMFGVAVDGVRVDGSKFEANASHFGCSTVFEVMPVNVAANTNLGAICSVQDPSDASVNIRGWLPRFPFTRVRSLTVRFVPTHPVRNSSGMVAMAWTPYTTDGAKTWYRNQLRIPTFRDVINMPGAVQGKPGDVISLRCNISGYAGLPRLPSDEIGLIHFAHQDNSHTGGDMIKPDEFSGQFEISGTVESLACYPHEVAIPDFKDKEERFADKIWDQLNVFAARYDSCGSGVPSGIAHLKQGSGFSCTYDPTTGKCAVKGNLFRPQALERADPTHGRGSLGEGDFDMGECA